MRFHVKHVLPGRIRVGYDKTELTPRQAVLAQRLIAVQEGIIQVTVNPITAAFLVFYDAKKNFRQKSSRLFSGIDFQTFEKQRITFLC